MTIVSTTAICLLAICALLLGRCGYISSRRAERILNQKSEINKLQHRLDRIADSSNYDRYYEIEEDELREVYNVNMKVYVRVSSYVGEHIDTICSCLIKAFPFDGDKDFAHNEAEELLDKLNEK